MQVRSARGIGRERYVGVTTYREHVVDEYPICEQRTRGVAKGFSEKPPAQCEAAVLVGLLDGDTVGALHRDLREAEELLLAAVKKTRFVCDLGDHVRTRECRPEIDTVVDLDARQHEPTLRHVDARVGPRVIESDRSAERTGDAS